MAIRITVASDFWALHGEVLGVCDRLPIDNLLTYLILITIPTNDAHLLYLLHSLFASLLAYLFATYLPKYFLLYPLAYILSYLLAYLVTYFLYTTLNWIWLTVPAYLTYLLCILTVFSSCFCRHAPRKNTMWTDGRRTERGRESEQQRDMCALSSWACCLSTSAFITQQSML